MSRHHVPGRDFNPRTPVGCDDITATLFGVSGKFQSTHPSGVRLCGRFSTRFTVVFQSTHPSGVRPPLNPLQSCVPEFQSTHPSGVRRLVGAVTGVRVDFNPRTPVGCDSSNIKGYVTTEQFQSTHPSGVRLVVLGAFLPFAGNFNPRTPVGCDKAGRDDGRDLAISIHAPQWGATITLSESAANFEFQSTHPSGVRRHGFPRLLWPSSISIHAPQWGATTRPAAEGFVAYFNPRTPVGCDQHTLLRCHHTIDFNPRTPVGCDWWGR